MKKFLLSLVISACLSLTTKAQTTHKFTVTLNEPITGQTLTQGVQYSQKFVIKNDGPTAIIPSDTLAYIDPTMPTGQVFIRTNITKAVNDTIQINKNITISSAASQNNVNYCVVAFMFANANIKTGFDTTGWRSCKVLNIVGTATELNEFEASEVTQNGKLDIYPNPAIGNSVTLDYVSASSQATEVVVFDIAGRKVFTNTEKNQFQGKKGIVLDISSLTEGLYLVEINQGGIKASGKLYRD